MDSSLRWNDEFEIRHHSSPPSFLRKQKSIFSQLLHSQLPFAAVLHGLKFQPTM